MEWVAFIIFVCIVSLLSSFVLSTLVYYKIPVLYLTLFIASIGAAIGNYRIFKLVKQTKRGVFISVMMVAATLVILTILYSGSTTISQQLQKEFYLAGVTAIKNQEWETARYQFTRLISLNPDYKSTAYSDADEFLAEAYFQLAREAVNQKRWQEVWDFLVNVQNTNENKFEEHRIDIFKGDGLSFVAGYQSNTQNVGSLKLRMDLDRMILYADGSLRLDLNIKVVDVDVLDCLFGCTNTIPKPDSVYVNPRWDDDVIPASKFGGFFADGQGAVSDHPGQLRIRANVIRDHADTISGFITFDTLITHEASKYCFDFYYGKHFEIQNICFPLDGQEEIPPTKVYATPTPLPITPTPTGQPVTGMMLKEPILASNKTNIALNFRVTGFEIGQDTLTVKFSIERTVDRSLDWHSDKSRSNEIYLETSDNNKYKVVEMRGIFDRNTTIMPGKSYTGELVFEKPNTGSFTLVYPDIKPLEIKLATLNER